MILPPNRVRILAATQPVRKGQDGLTVMVQSVPRRAPFTGTVFEFRSQRMDRLKLLQLDGSGRVMAEERPEETTFTCLKSTLQVIVAGYPPNRIDDLLPWTVQTSPEAPVTFSRRLPLSSRVSCTYAVSPRHLDGPDSSQKRSRDKTSVSNRLQHKQNMHNGEAERRDSQRFCLFMGFPQPLAGHRSEGEEDV